MNTIFGTLPLILAISATATGCASDPAKYAAMSSMELCMAYLTYPSYNVHQPARANELSSRGENCSTYQCAAAARNQANANSEAAMLNMMRAAQAMQPAQPQQYQQGTHTYFINGKRVTCTTNGSITNCY